MLNLMDETINNMRGERVKEVKKTNGISTFNDRANALITRSELTS